MTARKSKRTKKARKSDPDFNIRTVYRDQHRAIRLKKLLQNAYCMRDICYGNESNKYWSERTREFRYKIRKYNDLAKTFEDKGESSIPNPVVIQEEAPEKQKRFKLRKNPFIPEERKILLRQFKIKAKWEYPQECQLR